MARRNLTDRGLKALKPAAKGKLYDVFDAAVPGLGVRVSEAGRRTFILLARFPGSPNPTRRALGEYGAITLGEARERARDWLALIRKGVDPKDEAERQHAAERQRHANSFEAVANEFIRLKLPQQRKGAEVERNLRKEFMPKWSHRPITSITPHDVVAVIDEAVARGAVYQAHNLLGDVRRLFDWAISRGVYGLDRSPCDRMKPRDVIGKKALRTRVLDDDEMRALWHAAGRLGYPYGPLLRMLALTGQRKSEVAEATWSEFDLKKRLWVIPAQRMKADAEHVVPLSAPVIEILDSLPRHNEGDHLFSTSAGVKPVNGFSKAKARLDSEMLIERQGIAFADFVIHDIRRTMRTGLSSLPVPDLIRELAIAHTKPGLHKVYDQFAYIDEKCRALDLWAKKLAAIVGLRGAAEIIPLRAPAQK